VLYIWKKIFSEKWALNLQLAFSLGTSFLLPSAVCPVPFLVILVQIYYIVEAALFNAKSELAVYRFNESEEIGNCDWG
jgi:hypothetical protein